MSHIPTTSTAVEKLKRQAKLRRKSTGASLATELDAVAVDAGYTGWKHVTVCHRVTEVLTPSRRQLPRVLDEFLRAALAQTPGALEARERFAHGLTFAMNVKDVDGLALAGSPFEECNAVWPTATHNILASLALDVEEAPDKPLVDTLSDAELLERAREEVENYRYFRYIGGRVASSANDVLELTRNRFYFAPQFAWIDGQPVGDGELLCARLETPEAGWARLDYPLASLPMRLVKAGDETYGTVKELMRWAKQLEYIGTKVAEGERREMLSLIGGTIPYVFMRRTPDSSHYFLCHPGYAPVKGTIALTRPQLEECGIVAWQDAYGSHDGRERLSVADNNLLESTNARLLRSAARMLANLAVYIDEHLVAKQPVK